MAPGKPVIDRPVHALRFEREWIVNASCAAKALANPLGLRFCAHPAGFVLALILEPMTLAIAEILVTIEHPAVAIT